MSTKEALKPKVGITKKDEKRKAKKDKLTHELEAKEEAKREAIKQEQIEEFSRLEQQREELDDAPAKMGSKFSELLNQIQQKNFEEEQQKNQKRPAKKAKSDAIKSAKALLQSRQFQFDPFSTMENVTAKIQKRIEKQQI